jgi:hypothetical protein
MTSDASFAALCGVSPLEASSGKTRRRRLNRGGDRRANAALYRIALSRSRCDQRTRDYLDKHAAQGMTRREAIRCIKRYIAREVYNSSNNSTPRTRPYEPLDKHRGIGALVDAQDNHHDEEHLARATEAQRIITDCDQRVARYRAALEAGTDPTHPHRRLLPHPPTPRVASQGEPRQPRLTNRGGHFSRNLRGSVSRKR